MNSGSSSLGNGGVSLDLQPPPYSHANTPINSSSNNNVIKTNHTNNNFHTKNSPSFDNCIELNKKPSSKCPSSLGSVCESIGFDSMSYRTKSRGSLSTRSSSSGDELGPPEYDVGPHHERAVDVPPNFVAVAKVPPRYPKSATNTLQKSKESLASFNSNEKDAINSSSTTTTTTISHTDNNITPQTTNRNTEVYFIFVFFFFFLYFIVHFTFFFVEIVYICNLQIRLKDSFGFSLHLTFIGFQFSFGYSFQEHQWQSFLANFYTYQHLLKHLTTLS